MIKKLENKIKFKYNKIFELDTQARQMQGRAQSTAFAWAGQN